MRYFAAATLLYLTLAVWPALAACIDPPGHEQQIIYNKDYHVPQYCNGSSWVSFAAIDPAAGGGGCASPAATEGRLIYNGDYHVLQYCDGTSWIQVGSGSGCGGGGSCAVNSYSFPAVAAQPANTLVSSAIIPITTNACSAAISISGSGSPQFRICSDAACSTVVSNWGASNQTIDNGQYLQARLTTSAVNGTDTATVTIGNTLGNFSVDTAASYKQVFITSTLYGANLGGVSGADAKCASAATGAGLAGTYLAWIADSTDASAPASRFTQASIPYRRVDLTKLADNWAGLTSGTILTNVNMDQAGHPSSISDGNYSGQKPFFSNVNANGTRVGTSNCSGWTATSGSAALGDAKQSGSTWSNAATQTCGFISIHVLCVEQ